MEREEPSSYGEEAQAFMELGLTSVQSRIYVALSKLETATIGAISKTTKLDRSEVYRGMSGLQKLGLVSKTVKTPVVFSSVPMCEGLMILMNRKTNEYHGIETRTAELIRKTVENGRIKKSQEEQVEFIIVPEREIALRRWIKTTENAKEELNFIVRWKGFVDGLKDRCEHHKRLLNRGVKIRAIVTEPEDIAPFGTIIRNLTDTGDYHIKYSGKPPQAVFSIVDGKNVLINLVPTHLPYQTPSLCSNNPSLAAVFQDYFELKWRMAREFGGSRNRSFFSKPFKKRTRTLVNTA